MMPVASRAGDAPARSNQAPSPPANGTPTRDTIASRDAQFGGVFAIVVIGVVFGSLYPFDFHVPPGGAGALRTLVDGWSELPGRVNVLVNILFYVPFGLFAMLSLRRRASLCKWLAVVVVAAAFLSTAMELAQFFDKGRVTSAADVYSNTLGAGLGAILGSLFRFSERIPAVGRVLSNPVPTLLIGTWLAYRLFPYEPTIELRKYWETLRPLFLSPTITAFDLYRHTVIWLTVFALIAAILRRGRSILVMVSFAAGILIAKIVIIAASLSVAEIAGAALALCLWQAFGASGRRILILLAALLAAYIGMERLEPFVFLPAGRAFGWMPFASFLSGGSLEVNILSFFGKTFLYGSLIFLMTEAGIRLWLAASSVAMLLFATSWLETYLPGRSAEVTDAVMALLIAAVFSLLRYEPQGSAAA